MPSPLKQIQVQSHEGFISYASVQQIQRETGYNGRMIEQIALEHDITPLRYRRNLKSLSTTDQLKLLHSHIALIGAGGLGGQIAEMLARIGIGALTLFDPDTFEEHNLNRQNFSTLETLGREKVTVIKEALQKIHPTITIESHIRRFDPLKDISMIADCDLVIDALDDPQTKLRLAQACQEHQLPFIHGAIGGLSGQVAAHTTLEHLYHDAAQGAEATLGNPAFNVTLIASIQVSEAVKSLLSLGETLTAQCLVTDLLYNDFEILPL